MAILIRTDDVPPAQRHDAWRGVVCDTLGPLDCHIDRDTPLRGQIEAGRLGTVGVGMVQTSTPHSVHRTPGQIRRDGPELYRLVLAMSGSPIVAQDGRSARLAPGEFAIHDFTRPYELAYDSAVRLAVFSFPRELLSLPARAAGSVTALPMSAVEGTAALVAPLLRRVALDLDTYRPDSAARLSTVVMDLVATAVAERVDRLEEVPAQARREALLARARDFIERHLGDPDLDPAAVAAGCHLSPRSLQRLFEGRERTVAGWIRHRRLERCRHDLADPALAGVPVGAVAARWGLPDPAHFSRLFKRAYGMTPAEYRRAGLG